MARKFLITGATFLLAFGLSLEAQEPKPFCQEITQKLQKLETQISELEALLLVEPRPSETSSPEGSAPIANLEKQINLPDAPLLRHSDSPEVLPSVDSSRIDRLEKQIRDLEEALRQDREMAAERQYPERARITSPECGELCATLRLKSKPETHSPIDSAGPNLFGVFIYDILDGPFAGQTIEVAHGVRWEGRITGVAKRPVGTEFILDLVPLRRYPSLRNVPIVGVPTGKEIYIPRLR